MITKEQMDKILEIMQQVYKEAGKEIKTATLVDDIEEDGTIHGEVLIDKRNNEEIN